MRSFPFAQSAGLTLVLAALLFSPLPTRSAHRVGPMLSLSDWLYASRGLVDRRLRADFEPPSLLLLAYDSDWEPALDRILESAALAKAEVAIAPVAEDVDRAFLGRVAQRPGVVTLDTVLDTAWVRDFAPLQLRDALGGVFWYDFPYSDERPLDDAFPELVSRQWRARYERAWIPMDGGGVISNGEGLCAMTDVSVWDTRLDPSSRSDVALLLGELGCESIVVVPALPHEETGHVDMIAQFVAPDALIVGSTDPTFDPDTAEALNEAARRLARAGRMLQRPLSITRVPYEISGEDHLTYVNGTALDRAFLMPRYAGVDPAIQARARAALKRAMPGRRLVAVDADAMIERGGAVHCITAGLNPPPSALRQLRSAALHRANGRPAPALASRARTMPRGHVRLAGRRPVRASASGRLPPSFLRTLPPTLRRVPRHSRG